MEALYMKLNTLEDLFLHELQDLYDAENQIAKALPKMSKAASSPELKRAFENHAEETKTQIERLTQIFEQLGKPAKGKKCEAMKGLLAEGEDLMGENAEAEVLDAGLIASAQKVEHYEIASYGTVRTWAQVLGQIEAAELLNQTLDEESATDEKLSSIAKKINSAARIPA
jgi:ferritin-like metal-binding protein YciE